MLAALDVLDAARGRLLAALGPTFRPLLRDRELRVATYGVVAIFAALTLSVLAPVGLLAVGPLVLGVPHLLADVRYLVARPRLHRRAAFWVAIGAPCAVVWVYPHAWVALLAPALAAVVARAPLWKRAAIAALALGLSWLAHRFGYRADIVMAHAHNLVALVVWWMWAPRRSAISMTVIALFVIATVAIGCGVFDDVAFAHLVHADPAALGRLVGSLSPLRDPIWSLRLVVLFAFAQSVHYAVWVRMVPEEDRDRPGLRSFRATFRALEADVGKPVLALAIVLAIALLVFGALASVLARDGYLRLAAFHGPLELGALVLIALEGRRP